MCPPNIYDSQPPCQSRHNSLELVEAVTLHVRPKYQAIDSWSEAAADRDKIPKQMDKNNKGKH